MRVFAAYLLGVSSLLVCARAEDLTQQALALEKSGEAAEARLLLQRAAQRSPADAQAQLAYAEYLDRYADPETRKAYERALSLLQPSDDGGHRAAVSRRLAVLSLAAGDRDATRRYAEQYRTAVGRGWEIPQWTNSAPSDVEQHWTEIPGPLRSFSRMAAVSQDVTEEDILPAVARNVVTNGYQASSGNEALEQTEYLKLVVRYLSQARELEKLAGPDKVIRIATCESTETGELLRILGYRMRGGCGSEVVLETVNASRAFLTIDSGFPIAELEQDLRTNRPFSYDFKPTRAAVIYGADYWFSGKEKQGEFIDMLLADPQLCRLYLGMSKLDPVTAEELRKAVPVQRLKVFAHVLDFFGAMFEIRDGKAVVPGGARTAKAWEELTGVPPDQGPAFFERLLAKDDGWMASYFDALARIQGPVKEYLTEPERLKRFYLAIRGRVTSPGPARPVFRSNTELILLTNRLRIEPDGRPHIPGGIDVWRNLFVKHPHGKYDGKLTRLAATWKEPDDVIEALFALCRKSVENEPLKIFMSISDINRHRTRVLETPTVERLILEYPELGAQYSVFTEAPSLSDRTIVQYLDTIETVNRIRDTMLRANSAGTMQALVALWQIFVRQGSISASAADETLAGVLTAFGKLREPEELFDAGRTGVSVLLKACGVPESEAPQDRMIDLLAGTRNPSDPGAHNRVVEEMLRIFEAQRLVPLSTLFDLATHMEGLAKGERLNTALVNRFGSRTAEIESPRASLTATEKNAFAFGYWTERHIENQRKLNMRATLERVGTDSGKLREARGLLAPFLRDTLVGLVYIHYTPPGAQLLVTNPVFVRSHDFIGIQGANHTWRSTDVYGSGWPSSAGGKLVGSLTGLPYALAEAEQNFMIPSREQALIWGDLVPQMILSAKIPRWWNVSPAQLHWVGLHMRYAESLVAESAFDAGRRAVTLETLARMATPARVGKVAGMIERGDVGAALAAITPAELFMIAKEALARDKDSSGPLAAAIRSAAAESPDHINYAFVSRAFGTPKPTLTNSYQPELLYLRTFPTLMGYSSRIMAESWESNALYWAALADEVHLPPSQLNFLIPEWTQQTVERIFATHLEDWPAVLRSLRLIGDDIRLKARQQIAGEQKASLE